MTGLRKKVVQTEVDTEEYDVIVTIAKRKRMTIKEALREALRGWAASSTDLSTDPLFNLKPVEFKVKIKSDEIDAFLYGKKSKKGALIS